MMGSMEIAQNTQSAPGGRKYFFFDIDGTLACGPLGRRRVPESAREALRRLRADGHLTAIATGRSRAMAMPFYEQEGFDTMVSDGGNGIILHGEALPIEPLERGACIRCLEECEAKGFSWAVSPDDSQVRYAPSTRFEREIDAGYMETRVVPDLDFRKIRAFYKLYIACTAEEEPQLETLALVPHARQTRHCLFVEPVDKARGIREVMRRLGAPLSDVVVFGDGANDVLMFRPEWTSIAMGNAIPELKRRADYVTADVDDDGIWKACEHFGWV